MNSHPTLSEVQGFARAGGLFKSISGVVHARRIASDTAWLTDGQDCLVSTSGDWELTDGSATWFVAADVFDATYTHLSGDKFFKSAVVRARRLEGVRDPVRIPTREGIIVLDRGDWVLANPSGDVWGMSDTSFRERYEPLPTDDIEAGRVPNGSS